MPMIAETRPKANAVTSLNELKALIVQYSEQAQALSARADEEHRDFSDEEEEDFKACVDAVTEYKAALETALVEDKRSARQAILGQMGATVRNLPDPARELSRGALAQVHFMRENWQNDRQWTFRGQGDFAKAVYEHAVQGVTDPRLERVIKFQAAMDHNTPQSGGFLLPPAHNASIHQAMMGRRTNLMALCDLYPLTGNLYIELNASAETSRVAGSRWGGITSYWVEDGSAVTDSQPKIRLIELRPRQLATLVKVNNTLLSNATALEAFLDKAAVDDQIQTINNAIIRGDGVAKPKGFFTGLADGTFVSIAKETSQAAATIVDDNIHKMWARCLDEENAVWLINRDAVPELEALAATGISGTIPVMLANVNGYPTMAVPGPQTLKGRPIRRIEQCSTLGTQGDVILANMMGYCLAYRARSDVGVDGEPGIQKDMSMHLEFDKNRTAFRYIIALDGQAWLQSAITPENGSNKLSDFIVIDTRS